MAAQARFESTFGPARAADLRAMLRAVVASKLTPAEQHGAQARDTQAAALSRLIVGVAERGLDAAFGDGHLNSTMPT